MWAGQSERQTDNYKQQDSEGRLSLDHRQGCEGLTAMAADRGEVGLRSERLMGKVVPGWRVED